MGVGPEGSENALARVSLVNFHGHVILDKFVKPQEKVVDFRTAVSGVRPSDLQLENGFFIFISFHFFFFFFNFLWFELKCSPSISMHLHLLIH